MEFRKPRFFVLTVAMAMVLMVSSGSVFVGQTVSDEAGTNSACDLAVVFETQQTIATIGALDWESFEIGGETYLAVANHHNDSSYNVDSMIYKWNGTLFVEFQAVPTNSACDWESFEIDGETYLAVANYHNDSSYNINSRIYKWDGTSFVEVQTIPTNGACDWENFEINGETYLAVANYHNDSTKNIDSRIYQAIKCTKVSGMIYNETWTQEGSPYFVEDDILAAGLTIEPGVMVKFLGNYVFEVLGVLTATGTRGDPIIFTRVNDNEDGWQGIFFHQSTPGSELVYCTIEGSINSGIRFDNTEPTIENCTINNNSASGSGGGIYIDLTISAGTLVLKDCLITGNTSSSHGGGISADVQTGSLNLTGCEISNNNSNPAQATGDYVGGGIYASVGENGELSLSNCKISGNTCYSYRWCVYSGCTSTCRGGGIYCNGDLTLANCWIENNSVHAKTDGYTSYTRKAYSKGGGVYLNSGVLTASNCIVTDNSVSASGRYCSYYLYGGGIHLYTDTANLENCTVVNNINHGLCREGGTVTAINSIFYDNSLAQISGTVTATYSCVEGGWEGEGNIFQHPILGSCLQLMPFVSPCIDKGDPDPQYNDVCFPPSLGAVRK